MSGMVGASLSSVIHWRGVDEFTVDGVLFKTSQYGASRETSESLGAVWIMKNDGLIGLYGEWVKAPKRIVEVGVAGGGGAVLLNQAYRPDKLVAIDISDTTTPAFKSYVASERGRSIRPHLDVDQADKPRLTRLMDMEFEGAPIDLVIDDASHLYEPSLATFEVLFPKLRPGCPYILEDWGWSNWPGEYWQAPDAPWGSRFGLTNLVQQLVMAAASRSDWVERIIITSAGAVFIRGPAEIPQDSPLSSYYLNRGKGFPLT